MAQILTSLGFGLTTAVVMAAIWIMAYRYLTRRMPAYTSPHQLRWARGVLAQGVVAVYRLGCWPNGRWRNVRRLLILNLLATLLFGVALAIDGSPLLFILSFCAIVCGVLVLW